jgi:NMD protein affecting ribosome stability and mRNA decay
MICKICGVNETDNPDGICDDCKFSMISDGNILPNI